MTTSTTIETFRNATETVNRAEDAILATCSDAVRTSIQMQRTLRYDYLNAAQRMEAETMHAAQAMATYADEPGLPELCRSIARSRSTELMMLAARHGEAWLLYESIQDLPIESIVWRLCEAGYGDHALYLCGGQWLHEDEVSEAAPEPLAA